MYYIHSSISKIFSLMYYSNGLKLREDSASEGYTVVAIIAYFALIAIACIIMSRLSRKNDNLPKELTLRVIKNKSVEVGFVLLISFIGQSVISVPLKDSVIVISKYLGFLVGGAAIIAIFDLLYYRYSRKSILRHTALYLFRVFLFSLFISIVAEMKIFNVNLILILVLVFAYMSEVKLKVLAPKLEEKALLSDIACFDKKQLFKTRKYELESIKSYIMNKYKYGSSSSFAIAILGQWGVGKTSLINVLLKELDMNSSYSIVIKPLLTDDKESLLKSFYDQLQELFKKERIYTGKGSHLQVYYRSVMKIIQSVKIPSFEYFSSNSNETLHSAKKAVQLQINELLKKKESKPKAITILIDDFDRSNEKIVHSILAFIYEVANFNGCMVVFALDYEKLIEKGINEKYLEKFIYKRFDLRKLSFEEVFEYYIDGYVEELVEEYSVKEDNVKTDILNIYSGYIGLIEKRIADNSEYSSKNNNEEKPEDFDRRQIKLKAYKDHKKNVQSVTAIPRNVKRFIRETVEIMNEIAKIFSDNSKLYDEIDSIRIATCLAFVKCFYEEDYGLLIKNHFIEQLRGRYSEIYVAESIILTEMLPYAMTTKRGIKLSDLVQTKSEYLIDCLLFHTDFGIVRNLKDSRDTLEKMLKHESLNFTSNDKNEITNAYSTLHYMQYSEDESIMLKYYRQVDEYVIQSIEAGTIDVNDAFTYLDNNSIQAGNLIYLGNYIERFHDFLIQEEWELNENQKRIIIGYIDRCYDNVVHETVYSVQVILDVFNLKHNRDNQFRLQNTIVEFDFLQSEVKEAFLYANLDLVVSSSNIYERFMYQVNSLILTLEKETLDTVDVQRNKESIRLMCNILIKFDMLKRLVEQKNEVDEYKLPVLKENDSIELMVDHLLRFKNNLKGEYGSIEYNFLHTYCVYIKSRLNEFVLYKEAVTSIREIYTELKDQYNRGLLSNARWDWIGVQLLTMEKLMKKNTEIDNNQ